VYNYFTQELVSRIMKMHYFSTNDENLVDP